MGHKQRSQLEIYLSEKCTHIKIWNWNKRNKVSKLGRSIADDLQLLPHKKRKENFTDKLKNAFPVVVSGNDKSQIIVYGVFIWMIDGFTLMGNGWENI